LKAPPHLKFQHAVPLTEALSQSRNDSDNAQEGTEEREVFKGLGSPPVSQFAPVKSLFEDQF
jgi:hypothetical protein